MRRPSIVLPYTVYSIAATERHFVDGVPASASCSGERWVLVRSSRNFSVELVITLEHNVLPQSKVDAIESRVNLLLREGDSTRGYVSYGCSTLLRIVQCLPQHP